MEKLTWQAKYSPLSSRVKEMTRPLPARNIEPNSEQSNSV